MALVVVSLVVIGVAALSLGLFYETAAEKTAVRHQETSQLALDAADSGIVRAELEIRGLVDPDDDGIGTVAGVMGQGQYSVTATQDPDSAERWRLVAVGTCGLSTRRVEVGLRRRGRESHVESLYSEETLEFGGSSQTDGYDSRLGPYADQAVNTDATGSYASGGGSIGSGRDIVLHGSSTTVRGNAVPGPLHQIQRNGNPVVWGDTLARERPLDLPLTPYSDFQAAYLSNDNHTILGTNALGAETAEEVGTVSDASLVGLTDTQIEGLEIVDVLQTEDAALDQMTFGQILIGSYPTLLSVDGSSLTLPTKDSFAAYKATLLTGGYVTLGSEYENLAYPDGQPIDQDDMDDMDGSQYLPTPTGTPKPGRVSYNSETRELRATAGAAVVLSGGTYFFSGIRLRGRAYLLVKGPSTVYVTGDVDLGGGGVVNESGRPGDLRIFAHPYALPTSHPPDSSTVRVRGGSQCAAVIYGPQANVTIGGGDELFGSVVARNITVLGNVRFHYDVALGAEETGRGASLERLYWRELSVPPR